MKFVCRYLSHDLTGKNLSYTEAKELSDGGIWIVVVWESTASRALGGFDAGRIDAQNAKSQAASCGMPSASPIYFAVDFDASQSDQVAVNAYLDGAASVLGKDRVGVYGGYYVVKRALDGGHCKYAWQASAWSGGQWDSRAHIRQTAQRFINGVDCDDNEAVFSEFGQWRQGAASGGTNQTGEDLPYLFGNVEKGKGALEAISIPGGGLVKNLGLFADTGLEGKTSVRVAVGHGGSFAVSHHDLDSTLTKVVVPIPADADSISIRRENVSPVGDLVSIGWDAH